MKTKLPYLIIFFLALPLVILIHCSVGFAQTPNPALVGYFHNWNSINSPYIQLPLIDNRYNVIEVAFALPQSGTDYHMEFTPDQVSQATFISQMQTLQSQGKKVLISIGGATATVKLDNITERDTFISTMNNIVNTYGFDGIDIDLEGSSISVTGGTINAPTDSSIIYLIDAIEQIMFDYRAAYGKKLLLTMAPETAFVQGGQSAYGGVWGAYLPIIHALRDSIDILQVQLYNSGTMFGIDGIIYSQGTADFIVAMTEAVIQGFNTNGGLFTGLPSHKIAVALPACIDAAGGGYTDPDTVEAAINYLLGAGSKPGSYSLFNSIGYPDLAGMMTWSINWDAVLTCGASYEYAQIFDNVFGVITGSSEIQIANVNVFPNPTQNYLHISFDNLYPNINLVITDMSGKILLNNNYTSEDNLKIDLSSFSKGMYLLQLNTGVAIAQYKVIKI